jgi:hypothetical protein
MKVACLCNDDYANFMFCQILAMRSAGIDAEGYKLQQSVYKYPEQCSITRSRLMRNIQADVYMIFHSHLECFDALQKNSGRFIFVHTGTRFRSNADAIKKRTQSHTNVIVLPEFAKHLPNAHYVVGCIDDRKIQQAPAHGNRLGH